MMTAIAEAMIAGVIEMIGEGIETVTARGILAGSLQSTRRKRSLKPEDDPKDLAMTPEMTGATEEVHEMTVEVDN